MAHLVTLTGAGPLGQAGTRVWVDDAQIPAGQIDTPAGPLLVRLTSDGPLGPTGTDVWVNPKQFDVWTDPKAFDV